MQGGWDLLEEGAVFFQDGLCRCEWWGLDFAGVERNDSSWCIPHYASFSALTIRLMTVSKKYRMVVYMLITTDFWRKKLEEGVVMRGRIDWEDSRYTKARVQGSEQREKGLGRTSSWKIIKRLTIEVEHLKNIVRLKNKWKLVTDRKWAEPLLKCSLKGLMKFILDIALKDVWGKTVLLFAYSVAYKYKD